MACRDADVTRIRRTSNQSPAGPRQKRDSIRDGLLTMRLLREEGARTVTKARLDSKCRRFGSVPHASSQSAVPPETEHLISQGRYLRSIDATAE